MDNSAEAAPGARRRGAAPGLRGIVLLAAASVGLITAIQGVLPVIPLLQQDLGVTDAQVGLLTLCFVAPTALLALHFGMLGDRWPARTVLAASLVVYGACGVAHIAVGSLEPLLALRAVQGMAFAAAMPLTLVLVAASYHEAAQLRAVAVRQTSITLGELLLPLVAGALAVAGWKAPFVAQGLLIPLGILVYALFAPELGQGTGGRGALPLARRVMARRGAARVMAIGFARFFFKFSLIVYLPVLLVSYLGASVQQAALVIALGAAVTAVAASRSARLLDASRPSVLMVAAFAAMAVGLLGVGLLGTWWPALLLVAAYGLGDGFLVVMQDAYVARLWEPHERVGAAAVSQLARNLGKVASPLAVTALLLVCSLSATFLVIAALLAAGILAARSLAEFDDAFAPAAVG